MSTFNFITRLFSDNSNPSNKGKWRRQRNRTLRIEELESRDLLSVTFAEFEAIRSQYADLNLDASANASNYDTIYNIIEITADQLSDYSIRAAILEANGTPEKDLIVVRTTATQNKITLGSTALAININAAQRGSIAIVSLGATNLTIATQGMQIFTIDTSSTVFLAGLTITGANYTSSWVTYGGGIHTKGTLTLTNCNISGNKASHGGGIYIASGTVTITNSTIAGNSAEYYGGGIYNEGSMLNITNCIISGNSVTSNDYYSSHGGGIYSRRALTVTNCTIAKNSAGSGGGIYNDDSHVTIINCTISGNSAKDYGGGIRSSPGWDKSTVTLYNTIVAQNTNLDIYGSSIAIISGSNNISTFIAWDSGTANLLYNPASQLFVNSENGDYHLAAGSQAIDKGNNAYVPAWLTTDLDGNHRIANGTVDIGAYEYESTPTQPPAVPSNFRSTSRTSNSITLAWNTAFRATSYDIQYRKSDDEEWTTINSIAGTSKTIIDLEVNTEYTFQIRAVNVLGNSEWSSTISVTTDRIKLSTTTLGDVAMTSNSLNVTWNAVTNAGGYIVQYATNSTFTTGVGTVTVNSQSTTSSDIIELTSNTLYYIRVMATGTGTYSDSNYSAAKSIRTSPVAPVSFRSTAQTVNSVSLAWNSQSNLTGYTLQYKTSTSLTWVSWTPAPGATATTAVVTGLAASTEYDFRLMAKNASGDSVPAIVSATTDTIPVAPANFRSTTQTVNSVTLVWNPQSNLTSYTLL